MRLLELLQEGFLALKKHSLKSFTTAIQNIKLAMVIGVLFLFGGIQMARDFPAPLWFDVVDIVLAYISMGFLGWNLEGSMQVKPKSLSELSRHACAWRLFVASYN